MGTTCPAAGFGSVVAEDGADVGHCRYYVTVPDAQPLTVAGWREKASFPDWHVRRMTVKLDTGAATGAIDCAEIDDLDDGRVRFVLRLHRRSGDVSREFIHDVTRREHVRSASGHGAERLFVETLVRLGDVERQVELSLVSRHKMLHRVLLGRRALAGSFLVDSGRVFLLPRPPKKVGNRPKKSVKKSP